MTADEYFDYDGCVCHRCILEGSLSVEFSDGVKISLSSAQMILCQVCGNKRCPKASDHRLVCTGSNEPNQPGSIYVTPNAGLNRRGEAASGLKPLLGANGDET